LSLPDITLDNAGLINCAKKVLVKNLPNFAVSSQNRYIYFTELSEYVMFGLVSFYPIPYYLVVNVSHNASHHLLYHCAILSSTLYTVVEYSTTG